MAARQMMIQKEYFKKYSVFLTEGSLGDSEVDSPNMIAGVLRPWIDDS